MSKVQAVKSRRGKRWSIGDRVDIAVIVVGLAALASSGIVATEAWGNSLTALLSFVESMTFVCFIGLAANPDLEKDLHRSDFVSTFELCKLNL